MSIEIDSKNLDYYGIISGISQQIDLVNIIDIETNSDKQRLISIGQGVLAMMINTSGLTLSKPLYLTEKFYKTKPIDILIGRDIKAEQLNDDSLGRVLDSLYETGCDKIFYRIAFSAVQKYKIDITRVHADTTNIQVYGKYDEQESLITFGYAKNGRIDLKQFILSLIVSADGAIPLFLQVLPGNKADNVHFKDILQMFKMLHDKALTKISYAIFDCKMYTAENLKEIDKIWFITRVPESIKEAKITKKKFMSLSQMIDYGNDYKLAEIESNYGKVKQRWVIVYSTEAHKLSKKIIKVKVLREEKNFLSDSKKINRRAFVSEDDALEVIKKLSKRYKFHKITLEVIKNNQKWLKIKIASEKKPEIIDSESILGSIFILATNQLDKTLTMQQILDNYKDQNFVENRFNIFKNALCFSPKIYLKNNKRIAALTLIICLSLLIYALGERKIRKALIDSKMTINNQAGRPTINPTMRWIYQLFEGITVVSIKSEKNRLHKITNLSNINQLILKALGPECEQKYQVF